MSSALVVYSGGLDSTVLLYSAKATYDKVEAISFCYGAKHNIKELDMARHQCIKQNIKHNIIDLDFIRTLFKSKLLEGGGKIPEGHYAAENMKDTVVPLRNGIMLMIAAGYANSHGLNDVLLASHAGDHFIYPDCRPAFNRNLAAAVAYGTEGEVEIKFPFENLTKDQIVRFGNTLHVDFAHTWSCYNPVFHPKHTKTSIPLCDMQQWKPKLNKWCTEHHLLDLAGDIKPCGKCGTCVERKEAFDLAGIKDPLEVTK